MRDLYGRLNENIQKYPVPCSYSGPIFCIELPIAAVYLKLQPTLLLLVISLLSSRPRLVLEDMALHSLSNVADVVRVGVVRSIAQVRGVDATGVVFAQRRVDGALGPLVTPVKEVLLVVFGSAVNHVGGSLLSIVTTY